MINGFSSALKALSEKVKRALTRIMDRVFPIDAPLRHYGFRSVVLAIVGFFISAGYALFNAILAFTTDSAWYGVLSVYHAAIFVVRVRTVFSHMRTPPECINDLAHVKAYRNSGLILLLLNVVMSAAAASATSSGGVYEYSYPTVVVFAIYAVYKISMSVYHVFKTRRGSGVDADAIREINIIDALVSVFALQIALLNRFYHGGIRATFFNVITGALVNFISIVLSLFMVFRATKKIEKK